jgi:hypothetical protein
MICIIEIKIDSETHKTIDDVANNLAGYAEGKVLLVESMNINIEYINSVHGNDGIHTAIHSTYLTTYRVTYDTDIIVTKKDNKEIIFNELVMNEL